MNTAIQALGVLLPFLYLVSTVLYAMSFAGTRQPGFANVRRAVLLTTLLTHVGWFATHGLAVEGLPALSTWLLVSAVVLVTVVLLVLITYRSPQASAASIVLALATLLQLSASAFGPLTAGPAIDRATSTNLLALHVSTSVMAAAAVVLSGVYGTIYLILFRQMRRASFGALYHELPSLEVSARMTRRAALAGFLFLTVGLNLGIWVAHKDSVAGFDYADPHVLLTIIIWLHFGLIAFSQRIRGLTAFRASFAAVAGLFTLILALFMTLLPDFTFHTAS